MPKDFYDEFELDGNTVFARKNSVFVAFVANGELEFKPFDEKSANGVLKGRKFPDGVKFESEFDLCRFGEGYHVYVTELSDSEKETFDDFKSRIRGNTVQFGDDGFVKYCTESGEVEVSYDGTFNVDGKPAAKEFARYDSKFCRAERKAELIKVDSGKHRLLLDFKNAEREF